MKKTLIIWLIALGFLLGWGCAIARGQNLGAPVIIQPQFNNSTGVPLGLGKLCSYAAGTTTPLATYSDRTLMTTNSNPMVLSAGGYPQQQIYLDAVAYKFVIRTAGSDNTCSTGTVIATFDYQYDLAALYRTAFATRMDDKVCHTSQWSGSTFGARIAQCYDALPAGGGTIDGRGDEGSQTIATDVFSALTAKPVILDIGASSVAFSNTTTVPANWTFSVSRGASINPGLGTILNIQAPIEAGDYKIFGGSGSLRLVGPVRLAWWLSGDGASTPYTSADGTGGLVPAFNAVLVNPCASRSEIIIPAGTISLSVTPVWQYPSSCGAGLAAPYLHGEGKRASVFVPASNAISGLQIQGVRNVDQWAGLTLNNFGISGTGSNASCLQVKHVSNWDIGNIRGVSCTLGLTMEFSFAGGFSGYNEFQSNGVNVRLKDNMNSVWIGHAELGNATTASIDLRSDDAAQTAGTVITIEDVDLESSPTGIFVGSGDVITLRDLYCEAPGQTACVNVGVDSSGNALASVRGLKVSQLSTANTNVIPIILTHGDRIDLSDMGYDISNIGPQIPQTATNLTNLINRDWTSSTSNAPPLVVPGVGQARKNGLGVDSNYNLVANGGNQFPNFAGWTPSNAAITITGIAGSSVSLPTGNNVMLFTVPAGTGAATYTISLNIPTREFAAGSVAMWMATHAKIGPNISNASLIAYDNYGTNLGATDAMTTSWTTSGKGFNVNAGDPNVSSIILKYTFTVTDTTADRYVYIGETRLLPRFLAHGNMMASSPFDTIAGMSGTVAVTSASGGSFVNVALVDSGMAVDANFEVLVTPKGTAPVKCSVDKPGGGSAGKFNIWCDTSTSSVAYWIMMKSAMTP